VSFLKINVDSSMENARIEKLSQSEPLPECLINPLDMISFMLSLGDMYVFYRKLWTLTWKMLRLKTCVFLM
jgi:hypothetical protein